MRSLRSTNYSILCRTPNNKSPMKVKMFHSGESIDIFIRVDTFIVFSLAQIYVLIRFCLLKPLSQSTGTVSARVSNFRIWGNCSFH